MSLLCILLIGISIYTIHDALTNARPPSSPSGVVVLSPSGAYETYSEDATLADVLIRWGVNIDEIDEEALAAPLPSGYALTLTGDPAKPVAYTSLDARVLYTLGIPFNINTASAEELSLIPGIGERLSARIVAHRDEHGPFRTAEDLMAVPGIGEKKSKAIMRYTTFHDIIGGTEETQ